MKSVGIFLGLAALALSSTQMKAEDEKSLTRERVTLVVPDLRRTNNLE